MGKTIQNLCSRVDERGDMDDAGSYKAIRETLLLQLRLPTVRHHTAQRPAASCQDSLRALLSTDLDFRGESSAYASHNFHSFPAKFPPQLPRRFIEGLTDPGDVVLDPMVGSGTTLVEALLTGRRAIGFDIDPMALRICKTKVVSLPLQNVMDVGNSVLLRSEKAMKRKPELRRELCKRFGNAEQEFVDYWFAPTTQLELVALIQEIERVPEPAIREFLQLVFSSIIITKSGGVSLARDLAHTRPHRVDTKVPRSALVEYRKRLTRSLGTLASLACASGSVGVCAGNAQSLPLNEGSVDLIVTSPPYASNAIDYMRAHKFSLVWLGHSLDSLSQLRQQYIGHDAAGGVEPVGLPEFSAQMVHSIEKLDPKKSRVLHRYYSEISRTLKEMARVLKPGRAAIVVVGTSKMRGTDTMTDVCLAEIGKQVGLVLVDIAVRRLDRDKRMMPARGSDTVHATQIEKRMHEEYVIGFVKPG